jgi:hypothetical protein
MLDGPVMDALLRLSQRKGSLDADRVAYVRNLLNALPATDDLDQGALARCDCIALVSAAVGLAEQEQGVGSDVVAVVSACRGNGEAITHAYSLLEMAVRAQPPERRRRRTHDGVQIRAVGQDS